MLASKCMQVIAMITIICIMTGTQSAAPVFKPLVQSPIKPSGAYEGSKKHIKFITVIYVMHA